MNELPSGQPDFHEERIRMETLLQRFFDESIGDHEVRELLDLLDRFPDWEREARKNFETEQLFRMLQDKRKTLSPERLVELRKNIQSFPGESHSNELLPDDLRYDLELLDLDELLRMTNESLAVASAREAERAASAAAATAPRRGETKRLLRRSSRSFSPLLLIVGLFLLGSFVYWINNQKSDDNMVKSFDAVARITDMIEARWDDDENFKIGQDLEPGLLNLQSGIVKLEFATGTEVILEGPSEFLIKGRNSAFCQLGQISAQVPPKGIGFEVVTPTATIVDLGTAFSIQVVKGKSDVHVLKGKVAVQQTSKQKSVLTEGLAASLDFSGNLFNIKIDPLTFFSEGMFQKRKNEYVQKRKSAWDRMEEKWAADPSLFFRLTASDRSRIGKISGSRPDCEAVLFDSRNDRLNVSVMKETSSLTLVAFVRLHGMKHISNTLLIGDGFYENKGELLWQIDRSGIIQFHINDGRNQPVQTFDTQPVITRSDWNTWMMLTVVADAEKKTVSHYMDGRLVASFPWDEPETLKIHRATIGNDTPRQRKTGQRYFNGAMEQFLIYDRSLTNEEIQNLYEDHL